ncbi:translin-associated factor X-interacting protein 1 isoform X2 [Melanotaenia boesemani]|nr:translin-associated factor X-interacting protein 1 isoform X2 [Melanotaenia boesemani]XP_041853040.1 translin-associated factor X-interacting protein 1 isoform X2 [Melanotaenia boesemani]
MYTGSGRKPQFLMELESYVKKELHDISPHEPKFQELKLQVYGNVFSCFMSACRTYQPLLSAIKKEYENTLAHQQDQIRELEPLRSHLRLMSEECDRKFQMQRKEVQAEIDNLTREKQQLQKDIEAMKEKEKAMQTVVDHLQSELANQYLQYRKECDARKLLIWQLNDLLKDSETREHPADENTEYSKDSVELQLALKVCREDLTKTQEQLNKLKAEYWDVVPRRNWDILEQNHKQTLLQLKMLQGDFDLMKSEYHTLLEIYKKGSMETKTYVSTSVHTGEGGPEGQHQIQSDQPEEQVHVKAKESTALPVQEFRQRDDPEAAKSDEETDVHVTEADTEAERSDDDILSQIPP